MPHHSTRRELPSLDHLHIGLDLDGTLYNQLPAVCEHIRQEFNIPFTPGDVTAWDFEIPGTDDYRFSDAIDACDSPSYYRDMPLIPGAADAVRSLAAAGATLSIVTHRDPSTHDWSRDALARHNIPYDDFIEDVPRNKATIDADIDVLIDDRTKNVTDIATTGNYGILFLQPYNYDDLPAHDRVLIPTPDHLTPRAAVKTPTMQWNRILDLFTTPPLATPSPASANPE